MQSIIWIIITILIFNLTKNFLLKFNLNFINPILITIILLISILIITKTDYIIYNQSTKLITELLGPIVVMLAIPIYKNINYLKKNFFPLALGIVTSIIISFISVNTIAYIFKIEKFIMVSMYPKSITTPMAIEVTKLIKGNSGLTIIFVILSGIIGASLAEIIFKIFNITNPIAKGIGIGASAHGIGTSKALEMGESEAAASSLSMALTGVITVIAFSLISLFITF